MSCYKNKNCSTSLFLMLLRLLLLLILELADHLTASGSCLKECGGIMIEYPFGVGDGCYLDKYYEIECRRNSNSSRKGVPFLPGINKEVVSISFPNEDGSSNSPVFGYISVRSEIVSAGCSEDGKELGQTLNFTGTPFFIDGGNRNSLVAVGCSSTVSLTHIKSSMVGCELNCSTSKEDSQSNSIPFYDNTGCWNKLYFTDIMLCTVDKPDEEEGCNGNGCCESGLPEEPQKVIGIKIERTNNGNSTTRREQCQVAFLTDDVYTSSNATKPESLFAKRYATLTLGWIIQTTNTSFLESLPCLSSSVYKNTSRSIQRKTTCVCERITTSGITYANCNCNNGYMGNPYSLDSLEGCKDINECETSEYYCRERATCKNTPGGYDCVGDKTIPILIGLGAGVGVLVLVGGVWWLRNFLIKRKITQRKKKFFKRNGGLLLQQELSTRQGNLEKTIVFSSRDLEKATENFSENRVLGHGGQGTVYKGMLVDGRTVAVKKSVVIDEDKLQEFINEVVILSQINHRHIVKLLGCCLETEVPMLVYEFIVNGNLFQHIREESDDYTMIWGMRLRIAMEIAGALSYLHSSASSPIYHRDIKSSNILLDEKYKAKVADFGTSRSVTLDQTHWTTVVSGTVGYLDPEYYRSSQYTEKSDVYSFGVILAELITGEKPVIEMQNTQEKIALAEHFKTAMKEKRLSDIMDARIRDDCKPEQVVAVANLAMKCLSSKGKKRPDMREVFTELERICTSPEDSLVQIQIDEDGEEEEEEVMQMGDTLSICVTAPASSTIVASPPSDVEPLFTHFTW